MWNFIINQREQFLSKIKKELGFEKNAQMDEAIKLNSKVL